MMIRGQSPSVTHASREPLIGCKRKARGRQHRAIGEETSKDVGGDDYLVCDERLLRGLEDVYRVIGKCGSGLDF